jgi:hypothetical protein
MNQHIGRAGAKAVVRAAARQAMKFKKDAMQKRSKKHGKKGKTDVMKVKKKAINSNRNKRS